MYLLKSGRTDIVYGADRDTDILCKHDLSWNKHGLYQLFPVGYKPGKVAAHMYGERICFKRAFRRNTAAVYGRVGHMARYAAYGNYHFGYNSVSGSRGKAFIRGAERAFGRRLALSFRLKR